MRGGPLEMTLLETRRSHLDLVLPPVKLTQWQPNCPCAPCQGSHLASLETGGLYRARCEQGQSHLCDGQAGPPLQDLRASLYQPHAHPAVSSAFCFWFFQSMYQIQTSFLLLLLTVSPGQWKSIPESILPTPRLPSLFPMIQSLRSGHSYLSMMQSLNHGSLTPLR